MIRGVSFTFFCLTYGCFGSLAKSCVQLLTSLVFIIMKHLLMVSSPCKKSSVLALASTHQWFKSITSTSTRIWLMTVWLLFFKTGKTVRSLSSDLKSIDSGRSALSKEHHFSTFLTKLLIEIGTLKRESGRRNKTKRRNEERVDRTSYYYLNNLYFCFNTRNHSIFFVI